MPPDINSPAFQARLRAEEKARKAKMTPEELEFDKYFKVVKLPTGGTQIQRKSTKLPTEDSQQYAKRIAAIPVEKQIEKGLGGVTRKAADAYTVKATQLNASPKTTMAGSPAKYTGALLMPEAKDPTYAGSSFSKVVTDQKTGYPVLDKAGKTTASPAAKPSATLGGSSKPKPLVSQRSLFRGNVRDLMPSLRRDLTRRKAGRAARGKKTLGV